MAHPVYDFPIDETDETDETNEINEANETNETNQTDKTDEKDEENPSDGIPVPDIVVEDINLKDENSPLRQKAEKIDFPLSEEDIQDLLKLKSRFEEIPELRSLSLPQLGIGKRAFIFGLDGKNDGNGKELTFPESVWVNPIYKPWPGATLDEDYETCPSLATEDTFAAAPVLRFNRIVYRALDVLGRVYEGQAYGLAARVIQHEVDHLDGRLFVDYVEPGKILKLQDYCDQRNSNTLPPLQNGVEPD